MPFPFNPCIAIGVADKARTAAQFCSLFGGAITDARSHWVEVTAGPYVFYFLEDGTRDLAFSADVDDAAAAARACEAEGFAVDRETTDRVGETFVVNADGIRVNLNVRKR